MKIKIFILSLICCFAFGNIAAQETKTIKIAILETIDKANEVSYAHRLLVRATLAEAITATPGFEAYDRVDLNSIFGEQDFQRTGNVSNDQIKELGQMIGAQYIMVAEIAKLDSKTYYMTAKILDVETAQAINIKNAISSSEISSMQAACSKMANELLELPSMVKKNQTISQPVPQTKVAKTTSNTSPFIYKGQGHLTELGLKYDGKKYSYKNGYSISRTKVKKLALEDMKKNDPLEYDHYNTTSRVPIATGWTLFGSGLLMAGFVGPMCLLDQYYHKDTIWKYDVTVAGKISCISLCIVGSILAVAGIPCLSIGYVRQNKICDDYLLGKTAPQYAHHMPNGKDQPYITFSPSANGLGLAMNF